MYSIMPYRQACGTVSRPMNDFIRSFFDVSDLFSTRGFSVDVQEQEDAYILSAELPGMEKEQIQLSVEDDALAISADLNLEKKEQKDGYLYSERRSGHVERHFNLEGIDSADITASYQNGVLKVTLPKLKGEDAPEARKIDIS